MRYYVVGIYTNEYRRTEKCNSEAVGTIVEGEDTADELLDEWKNDKKFECVNVIQLGE